MCCFFTGSMYCFVRKTYTVKRILWLRSKTTARQQKVVSEAHHGGH